MTKKFKVKIPLPEALSTLVQEIQGIGRIVSLNDQGIIAEVETDDEYELGREIRELEDTIRGLTQETVSIPRPVLIEEEKQP